MNIRDFSGIFLSILIMACSSENSERKTGDHVWKEQAQTIDRARQAEQMLEDATKRKKKLLEQQTE